MMLLGKPHITEKSMGATAYQVYTFKVDPKATKAAIAEAVAKTFKVKVVSVRTTSIRPRTSRSYRTGRHLVSRGFKKAMVVLAPKQTISYFETKSK